MIWAVDIGNTRTVSGLLRGTDVLRRDAFPTERLRTQAGARAWAKRLASWGKPRGVGVSSVVPPVDGPVRRVLSTLCAEPPVFIRSNLDLGLPIHVRRPSEVGADRLVNAVAAKALYGAPVLVVDYGTATTFDVVDARGGYAGGAILPGIGTSLAALHRFTAKLPTVRFERVAHALGKTTQDAMRSGVYHGAVGQTRELLRALRKELGRKAPAIATGGWCHLFQDSGLFRVLLPDLTLQGLALILRRLKG